jgi:phosphatidate phosphatase APP1
MKIYLDIDDTLIHTDLFNMRPANHVKEFLTNVVNNHDTYWLTTHCNGDASVPVFYLSKIFPEAIWEKEATYSKKCRMKKIA